MFEIGKRHSPMFMSSDVKKISQIFMNCIEISDLILKLDDVEVLPIFQTARINEKNPIILKSKLDKLEVKRRLEEGEVFASLKSQKNQAGQFIEKYIHGIKDHFNVDSYIALGEEQSFLEINNLLPVANHQSKRPLIVFSSEKNLQPAFENDLFYNLDHPAIWLKDAVSAEMTFLEAFFSISPHLQMEVELNRFENFGNFGNYLVGMVRF